MVLAILSFKLRKAGSFFSSGSLVVSDTLKQSEHGILLLVDIDSCVFLVEII